MKIVILDDINSQRMILKAIIVNNFYDAEIIEAKSFYDVSESVDISSVDAFILDVDLHLSEIYKTADYKSGLDLAHYLKNNGYDMSKCIVISANIGPAILREFYKLGVVKQIVKPFEPPRVLKEICAALGETLI